MEALVQRGLTSDVAIDRIYSECGGPNTKVNDVIKELKHLGGLEMLLCICMLCEDMIKLVVFVLEFLSVIFFSFSHFTRPYTD